MIVTTTPNIDAELRTRPAVAEVIEILREDRSRGGYLHLHQSHRPGPFAAVYYAPDGTRYDSSSSILESAIIHVLEPRAAA